MLKQESSLSFSYWGIDIMEGVDWLNMLSEITFQKFIITNAHPKRLNSF